MHAHTHKQTRLTLHPVGHAGRSAHLGRQHQPPQELLGVHAGCLGCDWQKSAMQTQMQMEEVDAQALGYDAFCERFMAPNRPVVLRQVATRETGSAFVRAMRWQTENGGIDHELLRQLYGEAQVPVRGRVSERSRLRR